jgi:hypothetical protein
MMLPNSEIQGRIFIPVYEAERESGWSSSYIGRLARNGTLIAGIWSLDRDTLRTLIARRAKKRLNKA